MPILLCQAHLINICVIGLNATPQIGIFRCKRTKVNFEARMYAPGKVLMSNSRYIDSIRVNFGLALSKNPYFYYQSRTEFKLTNTKMDIKDIAKHYRKMSNEEFINIVTTKASGFRPEVFTIVENEIKLRDLSPDIFKGVLAQTKKYTKEEIGEYAKLLNVLPCPICNSTEFRLNGTIANSIKSLVFFTYSRQDVFIGCPDCLDEKNNRAIKFNLLLGWWGIPEGIIKTPISIYKNCKSKKENRLDYPNDVMLWYTLQNIGQIEAYKNDRNKLMGITRVRND